MKLIKQIYDLIALATNKGLTSYHSPAQIEDVVDQAQMGLFRPLIQEFAKTKQVRNELLPFQKRASVTITNKIGPLPEDFEHEMDAWVTSSSVDYEVRILEAGIYRKRLRDPVDTPSATNLIANIYNDSGKKIELSNQATPLVLNYFKRPVKPVYATDLISGQLVYSDGDSVDVEWSALLHDILVERSLLLLGLNMKDGQVMRVGQSPVPKEASIA